MDGAGGLKVGLFFGSFNPVHVGHMIIASTMLQAGLDEVWFVVSPQSPFKQSGGLMPEDERLHMVSLATAGNPRLRPCPVELGLPRPSYTANTLRALHSAHPGHTFALIMGGDNLASLHLWREAEYIVDNHAVYVYPRPDSAPAPLAGHPSVKIVDVPQMQISSTLIRTMLANGQDPRYLLTEPVYEYLTDKKQTI
ncbi:MAG: nicotinate-nucleotide adenylyltransferase [Bacteroidales bacterium]|nr:nicotinate-nucleotide adenylyltransferase [Bacteroidales bacterium]